MIGYGKGVAFKGASIVNEALKAFRVSRGSADRDAAVDGEELAVRSRNLVQNNTFSSALVSSVDVNVIGKGIHARPVPNAKLLGIPEERANEFREKVQGLFDLWADNKSCDDEYRNDFYQLQNLGLKTQLITGNLFALPRNDFSNPFGLKVKLLEGDRCRNPWNVRDTDRLAMGIETDGHRAIAYYFTKKPPFGIDDYCAGFYDTVRISMFDALQNQAVVHTMVSDRTDQRRGIPYLAPIISQLKQQERYEDAELLAAVVSAMFTVFITSNDTSSQVNFSGNIAPEQKVSNAPNTVELGPGMINTLANGEKIEIADPKRPNVNYEPFVNSIFKEAAASRGLSSEVVLRQFNSSYNAVRAAILESRKTYDKLRYDFVADFCQPIFEKFLTTCIATGVIEAPGYFDDPIKRMLWNSCAWIGDSHFMLDPTKETEAIIKQLDNQLIDRDTACQMITGMEYSVIAEKIAAARKIQAKFDLPEPGTVNKTESVSVQKEDGATETSTSSGTTEN